MNWVGFSKLRLDEFADAAMEARASGMAAETLRTNRLRNDKEAREKTVVFEGGARRCLNDLSMQGFP
jgi:hypothetical protein